MRTTTKRQAPRWASDHLAKSDQLVKALQGIAWQLDGTAALEYVLEECRDPQAWRKKPLDAATAARAKKKAAERDALLVDIAQNAEALRGRLAALLAPKFDADAWLRAQLATLNVKE